MGTIKREKLGSIGCLYGEEPTKTSLIANRNELEMSIHLYEYNRD